MADVPGGAGGLLCRDCKGKEADRLVYRIDPELVSLVAELRGHEQQAAEELGQWKTPHESAAPRRLAGGDYMSQALNRLRPRGSLPMHSPPMPRSRRAGRGWMA